MAIFSSFNLNIRARICSGLMGSQKMKPFSQINQSLLQIILSLSCLKSQQEPLASCFPILSSSHLNHVSTRQQCTSKYSVFLNFRGKDTRHNFVHPLHEALRRGGISAFKDDISVNKGDRIRQELFHAIKECRIAIVILSKNYAASAWCLEELVKIMKCKKLTIFPVFYDVCPSDVRHLRESVARAFAKHERNHKPKKLRTWKQALSDAAEISGFDLLNDVYNRDISKCIQDIVEEVQKKLEPIRREEHYSVPTIYKHSVENMTEDVLFVESNKKIIQQLLVEQMKRDKQDGGSGLRDLKAFNSAMLEKLAWRLVTYLNGLVAMALSVAVGLMKHNVIDGSESSDYHHCNIKL